MANIWCELWEVFFVSFKAKTLKRFSFTQKMLDLVLILFMFLVCSPCCWLWQKNNEQLKIQIYDHSLVPIPMWCEERWVSKPTSSPFSLPTITSVAPPTTTPLSSPWNQPYGAPSFSYFSPFSTSPSSLPSPNYLPPLLALITIPHQYQVDCCVNYVGELIDL